MFKLFHKKLNKKGFTLAELLIVVAIIAILVAIAIPIFTSALSRAEEAVKNANIRAVRGAAVVEIFDKWDDSTLHLGYDDKVNGTVATKWDVEADVSANGEITALHILPGGDKISADTATKDTTTGGYKVSLHIKDIQTVNSTMSST